MKLLLSFAVWALLTPLVAAGHAVLFEFNNGIDEEGKSCSATEWESIQTVMKAAVPEPTARRLGQTQRKLVDCTYCGRYCIKVGNGCVRVGRRLSSQADGQDSIPTAFDRSEQLEEAGGPRKLTECDQQTPLITAALDALLPTLVGSCNSLVAAPRTVKCVETTEECFVQNLTLWDARSDTVIENPLPVSGTSFCKDRLISFGATTNFFIGKMNFIVRGTTGNYFTNRTEWRTPYYLNGDSLRDDGSLNVYGTYFPVGNYTLTVTSEDHPSRAKTISFRAKNC